MAEQKSLVLNKVPSSISINSKALYQSFKKEKEIRELFDNAPDMFFAVDASGNIINANKELLSKLEYDDLSEILGKSVLDIAPGFTPEELERDMKILLSGKRLRDESRVVATKTGKKIPIRINANPFFDNKGNLTSVVASWRDVSQLVEMEHKLKDQNMAFEQVLESTLAGYWDWDMTTNVQYMSPTFKKMFGYEDHEVPNCPDWCKGNLHPDDLPGVLNIFKAHVESKGVVPFDNEVRHFHKNGDIVWVWCKGRVIEWDEEGNPLRMVGSHVDITNLKTLANSNKQLERFAYVASHDLQEPLRTVIDFVNLFKEDYGAQLDQQATTYLNFIETASIRMGVLIKGILAYSRVNENSLKELVNFKDLIDDVLSDLKLKIDQTQAKIDVSKMPQFKGHPAELHSLFLNLIGNAIKFTDKRAQPEIKITAHKKADYYQFAISDNGIGIDQKNFDKIFEIFKRLHCEEDYDGTGIGLAHCKKIVEMHGGKLWVESQLGKGSTFFFTLKI
ncbi:PAS domain-containing sensor histidine kinase [Gilvibacter sp.]|uniref:PAS domain-containing sensor histidine kinase n=1 Tax=Gilvibacter sp. TaxID=2729997 RepID=UPI003F4A27E6